MEGVLIGIRKVPSRQEERMLPFGKMGKFFQYKKGKMMARERSEEALGTGPCNWAKV